MKRTLLIVGAGTYSYIAYEIAVDMKLFDCIDFIDDEKNVAPNGAAVIGKMSDLKALSDNYTDAIVAIGNPDVRLAAIERISNETNLNVCTLISPHAYVSPSATLAEGVIVEPMAVVQSDASIEKCSLISSGAVIKHNATVKEFCYIDCNFVVASGEVVSPKSKKTLT